MELQVNAEGVALLLRAAFGPTLPRPKADDEMRWEDDGGALYIETEGWDHVIVSADRPLIGLAG